ncbi:MAG: hypothetical protein ACK5PF_11230 [bacterium]
MTLYIKAGTKIFAEDGEYLFTVVADVLEGAPVRCDEIDPPPTPGSVIPQKVIAALAKAGAASTDGILRDVRGL